MDLPPFCIGLYEFLAFSGAFALDDSHNAVQIVYGREIDLNAPLTSSQSDLNVSLEAILKFVGIEI